MRIELAKLLLRRPSVFLLDEPTNHLDIESIGWLENYLKEYNGAVVLISHDRAFLDNVTTRTIEISLGKVYDYRVPYSRYVELRREKSLRSRWGSAKRSFSMMSSATRGVAEAVRASTGTPGIRSRSSAIRR